MLSFYNFQVMLRTVGWAKTQRPSLLRVPTNHCSGGHANFSSHVVIPNAVRYCHPEHSEGSIINRILRYAQDFGFVHPTRKHAISQMVRVVTNFRIKKAASAFTLTASAF